jgi:ubiquinone/menaquinone biosynthesis C-methylase UbiE
MSQENVGQTKSTREHIVETYRHRARLYDITARLYYLVGYPQWVHRRKAVEALRLGPGDTVVEIGCGTGLNFPLLQQAVGPEGRIVGVDLTDAMLAQAQRRIRARGWTNVSLVQSDAVEFEFPDGVDAIVSTYALSLVPECSDVVAHGARALSAGGRFAVLDLMVPENAPRWLAQVGVAAVSPFGATEEWTSRRPWDAIRAAMQAELSDVSWTELFFGVAYLAVGVGSEHDNANAR